MERLLWKKGNKDFRCGEDKIYGGETCQGFDKQIININDSLIAISFLMAIIFLSFFLQ